MPVEDYDNTLLGQYIRAIENPDSLGFKNGRWYEVNGHGFDSNNRGFGVDIANNKDAASLTSGRNGRYLTEEEERNLRNSHIDYSKGILDKWTPKILAQPPSNAKTDMATGIVYRGEGIGAIVNDPLLRDAYYSGSDDDFEKAVNRHYIQEKKRERAKQHTIFVNNHKPKEPKRLFSKNWDEIGKSIKYGDGGSLGRPMQWQDLSMAEKADIIGVGVRNGLRSLPDIRSKWNEFAEGGALYKPSESIKSRIADWEGSSMNTNRSFEEEARDFNRVVPADVRNKLSQEQLDALYSYGYNVGMGNLRKRVLPALTNYVNGTMGAQDVANSMWAFNDQFMKGLQRRRNWEKSSFVSNSPLGTLRSHSPKNIMEDVNNAMLTASFRDDRPMALPPNPTDYGAPTDYGPLTRTTAVQDVPTAQGTPTEEDDNRNRLMSFINALGLLDDGTQEQPLASYTPSKKSAPFAVPVPADNDTLLDGSWFADGGKMDDYYGGMEYVSPREIMFNPETGNVITPTRDNGVLVLPEVTVRPQDPDVFHSLTKAMTEQPDAAQVSRPFYHPFPSPEISPAATLSRATRVYNNYSDAKDFKMSPSDESTHNFFRILKDNFWEQIPAKVSNCTLTATQWIDPNNPVKSAKSIVDNPSRYYYRRIPSKDASIGNLVIAKVPNKDVFHTMVISGFADNDDDFIFKGKSYSVKKGEPLVTYSSGGHDNRFLRKDIPLSVYTANSDGKTENLFYKYGLTDFQLRK